MQRRLLSLVVALVCALAALPVGLALAAAELASSTPAAGATLADAPGEVRVVFNKAVTSESTLTVVNDKGVAIDKGDSRLDTADSANKTLVVSLKNLDAGRYSVNWFSVSADDLSLAEGSFNFNVGAAAATSAPATAATAAPATSAPATAAPATSVAKATATGAATRTPAKATPTSVATKATASATAGKTTTAAASPTRTAATQGAGVTSPAATPTRSNSGLPDAEQLPHTAGNTPAPWMFGLAAALAALAVWVVRPRR